MRNLISVLLMGAMLYCVCGCVSAGSLQASAERTQVKVNSTRIVELENDLKTTHTKLDEAINAFNKLLAVMGRNIYIAPTK